ncbi:hypothetical protein ACJMK2_030330 [Sinanodonta woodiana]|uniref:Uncharacterized protein n=1 Tax=Sinanodonta woodiana TaxID=1069815 RepID=A0ABD3XGJ5_SINWO
MISHYRDTKEITSSQRIRTKFGVTNAPTEVFVQVGARNVEDEMDQHKPAPSALPQDELIPDIKSSSASRKMIFTLKYNRQFEEQEQTPT